SIARPTLEARKTRRKGHTMDQDTLWNACEDQDLDAYGKGRVEELLTDSPFLAWLDQQEADSTSPYQAQDWRTLKTCFARRKGLHHGAHRHHVLRLFQYPERAHLSHQRGRARQPARVYDHPRNTVHHHPD